jgi:hypothetical protein
VTGVWQLPTVVRGSLDEALPDDLAASTDAGERPVFLGLGSMPVLDYDGFLAMVTEATRSLGVRAVVNMPLAGRDASVAGLPEHLRTVGAVDHELLLRHCSAAVHHGGAGTLAASLRAGLPTMVCSVWADQPARTSRSGGSTALSSNLASTRFSPNPCASGPRPWESRFAPRATEPSAPPSCSTSGCLPLNPEVRRDAAPRPPLRRRPERALQDT